jgi:fumarate hydratase, class II
MKDPTMLHDAPIGIGATGKRHETDSMGGIDVPADRYWEARRRSAAWCTSPSAK